MTTANKILIAVVVLALVAVGVAYFNKSDQSNKSNTFDKSDLIRVFNPAPGATVTSPLTIEGEARGYWFFEASFPVKLVDEAGNLVVQQYAEAQSEWMTEDFVPFRSELVFNTDAEKGFLVLEKDNPSGLPEHADELRMPVYFEREKMTVKAFFNNSELDPEFSCVEVFPVERQVMKTPAVARAALEELLKGPTENEKARNFLTSLPAEWVKIQKLAIENGIAYADFNSFLEFQVGGSCRVTAIRSQIIETLKQFPTVRGVVISIDGRTEDILQP